VWVVRRFKPVFEEITGLPSEYVMAINYLWLEVIRNSFDSVLRKSYILDSAPYFFDEVDRIAQSGFVPSNDDVLRARITTTGINEYTFKSGPLNINMIDVGGQRPERRKWIETFDNVTTLIFCVAISEYDHMLREEPRQNRLLESFQLWESVVNSKWFQRSSVVLFLNKKDIFRHKLRTNPLPRYFPEYRPPDSFLSEEASYEHAAEFIKNKFLAMNYGRVQIYPYLTCATDTKNIDLVFAAVKETVLANNLRSAGIL
jgi:guanine nucleotide-binding protein subunit alpha